MKNRSFLTSLLCFALSLTSATAAVDLFAKFEGGNAPAANGESLVDNRTDWIDINSFEMGIENTVNIGSISTGGGSGKASFKNITLTKRVDKSSAPLMTATATGQHYDTLTLEVTRTGGAGVPPVILKIELKLVLIKSVSAQVNEGDDVVSEDIVIAYGAHRITTFTQNQQGVVSQSGQHVWSAILNNASFNVN